MIDPFQVQRAVLSPRAVGTSLNRNGSIFAVRLVCAEFYQASPVPSLDPVYSEFRGSEIKHVPVIRIFGSTPSGEKTCLHVHGVFPYFYVPYTGKDNADRLGYRLAASLDAAINVSLGSATAANQHVFKVQLISGMPFYGYHEREHQYFKVYFYNPGMIKRAANLLQNGAVLNESLQPHEAHIPYVQQFMIDYNLHGMSMVELRRVKRRLSSGVASAAPSPLADCSEYLASEVARQSTCRLEVDALALDILNRREIEGELSLNPGLAAIWAEEKARRLQFGFGGADSELVRPSSPPRPALEPTESDVYQRRRLAQRLTTVSSQNDESATSAGSGRSQSSYPLETEVDGNLIAASCVEHHIGPPSETNGAGSTGRSNEPVCDRPDPRSSSLASTEQACSQSLDCSVLDAGDVPLLDILNGLADENTGGSTVDYDSPLGSQRVDSESPSNRDCRKDENDDLNLTMLQLDSLSWSQCDERLQRSGYSGLDPGKAGETTGYNYLRDLSLFDLDDTNGNSDDGLTCENIIPQCDGAGDPLSGSAVMFTNRVEQSFASDELPRKEPSSLQPHSDPAVHPTTASLRETPNFLSRARRRIKLGSRYSKAMNHAGQTYMRAVRDQPNIATPVRYNEIPSVDGPADFSSGDSDSESDVTLDRHEKRICNYGSGALANQEKLIDVTGRKRGRYRQEQVRSTPGSPDRSGESSSISCPGKTSLRQSPSMSTSLKAPRSRASRCYSPLSITVRSPRKGPGTGAVNPDGDESMERVRETLSNERNSKAPEHDANDHRSNYGMDGDDNCDVTFTQYWNTQLKQNAKLFSRYHENIGKRMAITSTEVVVVPRFNPPSLEKVTATMGTYGIPVRRSENPFFGNHADVTNRKEVAHKSLRIPSKCLVDLPQFQSHLEFTTGIDLWRFMKFKEVHPSGATVEKSKLRQRLTGQNKTVIAPLVVAPLPKIVKTWSMTGKANSENFEAAESSTSDKHRKSTHQQFVHDQPQEGIINLSHEADSRLCGKVIIDGTTDASSEAARQSSSLHNDVRLSRQLGISCGQIEGSSQVDHFKMPCQNLQDIKPLATHQYLTILCLELHTVTRGDLLPDPQHDAIRAIFYAIHNDAPAASNSKSLDYGVVACDPSFNDEKSPGYLGGSGTTCPVSYAESEGDLFDRLLSVINETDPDILVGWELESLSWGYLFQRAASVGINLAPKVSRIPCVQRVWEPQTTELNILTEIKMPGRIVLDIWRIMRHEISLQSYTFENIMYHVMHQRLSCPSFATLTRWWEHRTLRARSMVVEHYITKVVGILKLIQQLDIIGKTTEFARLYGIQFFEVFSRGSQFQVESVMLRLAKPSNYVPVSPSVQQRAAMRAPESLPLIMEPESIFYSDPLIVLDFQSLYPSIIIAHNYCFSTCLGRIENIGQSVPFEFGATSLRVTRCTALKLEDKLNFSPCGVAFVKPEIRVGILPRMLTEYLDTRLMVKKAMKDYSPDAQALQRALYSKQRGLKLLANVTFGYTHANFSGRMPCIEIGDSIVSKARETLERAIRLVETTKQWNARVVYGDTDSLFVLLPGRSRSQAFQVGAEIASAVTADNPKPMKLKLEKIMQPSILQTKKRYCGYMYESPDQAKPVYLAKGIETVRRDGCPAVSKILEKSLRILFDTRDVSQVKCYVTRQLDKILRGRVSIQDLTFAKEFRGLQGYKSTACVPALELTRRLILKDPRAIPRTSERVPYVIVAGAPNQPLFQCVRSPWELIKDTGLRPNALYYTTRVIIPPLNRCLNLLGVNVYNWYEEMPHRRMIRCNSGGTSEGAPQKSTISQYFGTVACAACGHGSNSGICIECSKLPNRTLVILHESVRQLERARHSIEAICQSCVGRANDIECASLDCPVLYRRARSIQDQHQISYKRRIIDKGNSLEL